jgi:hypothetical protein
MQRRRSIPHTLEDQITAQKARLVAQVARLRRGPRKDELLEKIRQLEIASYMNAWLTSPGLQPKSPRLRPHSNAVE